MKFTKKVLAFVGFLALGFFLSCASSIEQQTLQSEKAPAPLDLEHIAEIGKAATVQIGSLSVEGPPSLGRGFFILNVRLNLKADIEAALRLLK